MSDEPSLRRQWILLKALSSRRLGLTVREMAADLDVSDKTVRRDLALFRRVGFPLEESIGEFGRKTWRIKGIGNQPPLSFSFEEAAALYLGRRLLAPLAGTALGEATRCAFRKIRATLGPTAVDYLDRFQGIFHFTAFGASDYSLKGASLDAILIGIEDYKAIHILYQSDQATEPAFRDVYPYGLTGHRGALYLIALDPREDKIKHYKVDRIEAVEISSFPFPRPKDFDQATHLASAFGIFQGDGDVTVKVRFAPPVVRYVREGKWHASQKLTPQRDGSLIAEFRLSCTEEIKSWVLSFGRKAVVLEPEELRREIVEELEMMSTAYSKDRTRGLDRGRFLET